MLLVFYFSQFIIMNCQMSKVRTRKTRITCEEDLFEDVTNKTHHVHYKRHNKFSFSEESNYKIQVSADTDQADCYLDMPADHKEMHLKQAFKKVKHTVHDQNVNVEESRERKMQEKLCFFQAQ